MMSPAASRLAGILLVSAPLWLAACRGGADPPCDYANPQCPSDRVCAFVKAGQSACIPFAVEDTPLLPPFEAGHAFACSQSGRSAAGRTHSFGGDVFAVDLFSPSTAPTVDIVSPVDGDAYPFDGCEERAAGPDARNDSRCGLGYGNHVKIWDGEDIYLLAHLARVEVKGGRVRRGQVVGIEGVSGAAGSRHVHLAVTRPAPGEDLRTILETPGYKGSVPVRVRYGLRSLDGAESTPWADELRCAEGMAPSYVAPRAQKEEHR